MAKMLHQLAESVGLVLDAFAVLLVAAGAAIAAGKILYLVIARPPGTAQVQHIFIEFGRWLVAALTFQLGSDIVSTTITPTWDDLGRLAAVAGIRTFLTYFLDRDLERALAQQHEHALVPDTNPRVCESPGTVDGLSGTVHRRQ
ncbi:MAG: DUF1622 domain-containing protein [Pseudoxanthomonas sp.]